MASIIRDSIEIMGDKSVNESIGTADNSQDGISSITWLQSIKDWWNFSSSLMKPTIQSERYKKARMKNIMIEYELYKAILSEDIHIYKPQDPVGPEIKDHLFVGRFVDTKINESGDFIHEFYLENRLPIPEGSSIPDPIVIVHGYMAASGYFVKNFETLVKSKPGIKLHVFDMPGFGNSSRPKLPKSLIKKFDGHYDQINQIILIENWFIDRFEAWRLLQPDLVSNPFTIMSHSMGAYLICAYLMKYGITPNKPLVSNFVLISPMGTESNYNSLINHKPLQLNHHELGAEPLKELVATQSKNGGVVEVNEDLKKLWERLGKPKFPQNMILKKLWQWNISPFQLLQMFGPAFSKILGYWSFQRFKNLKDNAGKSNTDLILKLHNYSYSIFNQFQGSGELSITKLVNFEILPKLPLGDRKLDEFFIKNKINTLWLYGEKDWMNVKGGELIYESIKAHIDENPDAGFRSEIKVVKNAGHHIYLDNPEEFNSAIMKFLY